ncbi:MULTISPECIES: competence type IV pilus minor pilin ComGD [Bacillaceae]|uniref:competence type IV pilus minor pilin ComGD n=1 Tax=Bacillaceae TaxID=186817 RepID=UPI0006F75F9F|nr:MULTISPECIES: competence type IV pilus minor pilin ComGD [Bacillaceae]MDF2066344.1 competence type IV pilus minor pilin ComGD [Bacillus sp. Cr_A10]
MKRYLLHEKGFTFIEMLLVLAIVMVVSASIIFVTSSKFEKMEEKRFFKQFHLDVQSLQSTALAEGIYTHLNFFENGTKYKARHSNEIYMEYELPKGIRLSRNSYLKEIVFHPNGTVKEFGTLLFETDNGLKEVYVYIGKGKLKYE